MQSVEVAGVNCISAAVAVCSLLPVLVIVTDYAPYWNMLTELFEFLQGECCDVIQHLTWMPEAVRDSIFMFKGCFYTKEAKAPRHANESNFLAVFFNRLYIC